MARLRVRACRGRIAALAAMVSFALMLPWWAGPLTSATAASIGQTGQPPMKHGGSMTVLEVAASEGADPQGLDPATNANGGANEDYMDAIYGELFALNGAGQAVPDLATGYKFLNGMKTVDIFIPPRSQILRRHTVQRRRGRRRLEPRVPAQGGQRPALADQAVQSLHDRRPLHRRDPHEHSVLTDHQLAL